VSEPAPSTEAPSWWAGHDPQSTPWLSSNFPCRAACPVGTNAGGYVSLVAQGRYAEAWALARAPNPFASVCGRVCAHPCEAACRRGAIDAPIHIRALKRFVNERHGIESERSFEEILEAVERPREKAERPGRVAIIGAGPAGLACAHDLALMGHHAVVFDAAKVGGGMMRMGIPAYRLPRAQLDREIEFIRWLGVEMRFGVEIGKEVTFAELTRDYDAVFIGAGCRKGRGLKLPGVELSGVITAIDFLVQANLDIPVEIGKRVVVVGGGIVAYDAARSARRFGGTSEIGEEHHNLALDAAVMAAKMLHCEVTVVSLEARDEMPADPTEIEEGAEEGITLINRRGPRAILGENGKVTALRTIDVARVFDEQHRFAPLFTEGTEKEIPCDTVVLAIGQTTDLSFLGDGHGVVTSPQGFVKVDRATLETSRKGVYSGGDVAFGPRIVIEAVADGRRAAKAIDTQITGRGDRPPRFRLKVFDTFGYSHPFAHGDYESLPRRTLPVVPIERRGRHAEVEQVLGEAEAREEGSRCLHCWVNTVFDSSAMAGSECIQCGGCVDVCPEQCIDLVALRRISARGDEPALRLPDGKPLTLLADGAGAALLKDETACIRCGLCARRCPVGLITMQAIYREDEAAVVRLADTSM
jgi:formate dehydrogenase beta subunit